MKVLLIQPAFTIFKNESKKCHPPLGLAYLAAVLKEQHEVVILDALAEGYNEEEVIDKHFLRYGLSFENIKTRIEYLKPDIVGVSCLFSAQSENVHKICELVKEIDKKIVTILGGAHPSAVPEKVLKDNNVDFVVIGEGENTLNRILEFIEKRKAIQKNDIDGMGFRLNGDIKINKKERFETELDNIPFPYWDIFPLEKYFKINNPHGGQARRTPFLPLISSRGCPFECIFCSIHNLWGRNYRKRSAKNVLSEIEYLINKFRIKEILFEDDNLTLNKNRAKYIFQGILERQFDLVWSVPNGIAVQTLDDELLELMKKSGCYRISIGIESGDEYVLKNIIKKPIVLSQVKPMIDKARSLKMETVVFFVVGFPGESRKHLYNTLKFARRLGADNTNFFFATPLPGTRLFRLCKELNLINSEIDCSCLKSDYPSFSTEYFSKNELNAIIFRQQMIMYLLFLFRHPFAFFQKLLLKLKFDRRYFIRYRMQFQRKRDSKSNTNTITGDTSRKYDFLWSSYQDIILPRKYHFDFMQEVIPEKIVRGSLGLEIGCGGGWDTHIMAKGNPSIKFISMDISDGVYLAAEANQNLKNVSIIKGSAIAIPLKDNICDFVYSFGVLHHISDYKKGFLEISRVLKKQGACFLYLYEDHSDNTIKYLAIKIISFVRKITTKIPPRLLYLFSYLMSPLFVILFSYPAKVFKRFSLTHKLYEKMPFNFGTSLFSLKGDIYDRFSVPIEHRFSRKALYKVLEEFKFYNIQITKLKATAGWVTWGYKK